MSENIKENINNDSSTPPYVSGTGTHSEMEYIEEEIEEEMQYINIEEEFTYEKYTYEAPAFSGIFSMRKTYDYSNVEKLPFLVYGTLRPNCGNYEWALKGRTSKEEIVTVEGYELVSNGGFPYALNNEKSSIIATLVTVEDEHYSAVIEDLDSLEGYTPDRKGNLYERIIETVLNSEGEEVRAYIYSPDLASQEELRNDHPVILSGDWMNK